MSDMVSIIDYKDLQSGYEHEFCRKFAVDKGRLYTRYNVKRAYASFEGIRDLDRIDHLISIVIAIFATIFVAFVGTAYVKMIVKEAYTGKKVILSNVSVDSLPKELKKQGCAGSVYDGVDLKDLPSEFSTDPELVKEWIKTSPATFKELSPEMKADKKFLLELLQVNASVFKYFSEEQKDNEEFAMEAVKRDGMLLEHAGRNIRKNIPVVKEAVMQNGMALQFAPDLDDNPIIVMEAVRKNGGALFFASNNLKKNFNIAYAAIRNDADALRLVHPTLIDNPDLKALAQVQPQERRRQQRSAILANMNLREWTAPQYRRK